MAEKKQNFPRIGQKRLDKLIGILLASDWITKAEVLPETNNGRTAINVGLDFLDAESAPEMSEEVDAALSQIDFYYDPDFDGEGRYGRDEKYYLVRYENQVWVAVGDNCYGFGKDYNEGRILITWREKLAQDLIPAGLPA